MKGQELSIKVFLGVIFLVFVAVIFWAGILGNISATPPPATSPEQLGCQNDASCSSSPDGFKCLQVYPAQAIPFCGCITNIDCPQGSFCGSDNKCS